MATKNPPASAGARRTQLDRSTETRAILISAAIGLLHEQGFANTTTAFIAKRAGVTTGALHYHFPTKDDLIFAVLDHVVERVRGRLEQEDHVAADGRLSVPGLVHHLWEVYGAPEYWAIWEIIIGTRSDPAMHRRVVAHRVEAMRHVVHPWLARNRLIGASGTDILALFEFTLIAIRGLRLERFLDKDEAYFERNLHLLADLVGERLETLMRHDAVP